MSIAIQYTNQIKVDSVKFVVYGPAKIGKTRLTATGPAPFLISTEKGELSLRKESIPYTRVDTVQELGNVYTWLYSSAAAKYKTLAFDSVSDLAEIVIADEKRRNKNGQKAYGNLNDTIMQIFRDFRDMPNKHILFIAKEEQFYGANNLQCVKPTMPDKYLTTQLPYTFDVIGRMAQTRWADGSASTCLQVTNTEQVIAGDRSGTLDMYEPPNLAYIIDKITKG